MGQTEVKRDNRGRDGTTSQWHGTNTSGEGQTGSCAGEDGVRG